MKDKTGMGQLAARARRRHGLTQEQLAIQMGYAPGSRSGSVVQALERTDNEPRLSTLARVAAALGYEIHLCLREPGQPCDPYLHITI